MTTPTPPTYDDRIAELNDRLVRWSFESSTNPILALQGIVSDALALATELAEKLRAADSAEAIADGLLSDGYAAHRATANELAEEQQAHAATKRALEQERGRREWVLVAERLPEDGSRVEYFLHGDDRGYPRVRICRYFPGIVHGFGGVDREVDVFCWRHARPVGELPPPPVQPVAASQHGTGTGEWPTVGFRGQREPVVVRVEPVAAEEPGAEELDPENELCATCNYTWFDHAIIGSPAAACPFKPSGKWPEHGTGRKATT